MDIFELVDNEKFFHPLSSQNRRIYYECILSLIEKSREVPVLYDSDARNCVALYLSWSSITIRMILAMLSFKSSSSFFNSSTWSDRGFRIVE